MPSAASRAIALVFVSLIMLVGPCLLVLDAVLAIGNVIFLHASLATEGTVIGQRAMTSVSRRGYNRRYSEAPVFQFTAEDGQTYTVASNMGSRPPEFKIGQHVRVLYLPRHPERAKIDSFLQLWLPEVIVGVVGTAFTVLPALVLIRRLRQARIVASQL